MTTAETSAVVTHQRADAASAAGNSSVTKRSGSRQDQVDAPVTAARPRATSDDSRDTRAGSGEDDRTTDRSVAVRR